GVCEPRRRAFPGACWSGGQGAGVRRGGAAAGGAGRGPGEGGRGRGGRAGRGGRRRGGVGGPQAAGPGWVVRGWARGGGGGGVPFPVWYCAGCGEVTLADPADLPVDPTYRQPEKPCACGSTSFTPEEDVMDTWATSSLSPQIVGRWLAEKDLYERVFPMSLRPQ